MCVTDRKVARAVGERSYGQLREVCVSLVDLTSYFSCPRSYRQHGNQTLTEKIAWQMDLDSVSCAEGAAWKVTLRHLHAFEEAGRRYGQIGMHMASMM